MYNSGINNWNVIVLIWTKKVVFKWCELIYNYGKLSQMLRNFQFKPFLMIIFRSKPWWMYGPKVLFVDQSIQWTFLFTIQSSSRSVYLLLKLNSNFFPQEQNRIISFTIKGKTFPDEKEFEETVKLSQGSETTFENYMELYHRNTFIIFLL